MKILYINAHYCRSALPMGGGALTVIVRPLSVSALLVLSFVSACFCLCLLVAAVYLPGTEIRDHSTAPSTHFKLWTPRGHTKHPRSSPSTQHPAPTPAHTELLVHGRTSSPCRLKPRSPTTRPISRDSRSAAAACLCARVGSPPLPLPLFPLLPLFQPLPPSLSAASSASTSLSA
ncbi:hypothetical protein B484DRAFT_459999 [Ochromonadaceae sp. CCMP2298]|nr:hypothetical protein B484DRAFT_459999 [Ochromonadaceae sp. CCMP2298]